LAAAGLRRLGVLGESEAMIRETLVKHLRAQILDHQVMLPAPGQGALALEIHRSLSIEFRRHLADLDNLVAHAESLVERAFLATLEAGCTAPVGAHAVVEAIRGTSLDLTLTAVIGRTLLSSLSEPLNGAPALRLEVRDHEERGDDLFGRRTPQILLLPWLDTGRFTHADQLATALNLDMKKWFTPTAANYFGKVGKPQIIEALQDVDAAPLEGDQDALRRHARSAPRVPRVRGAGNGRARLREQGREPGPRRRPQRRDRSAATRAAH
jgi:hypothetical protein